MTLSPRAIEAAARAAALADLDEETREIIDLDKHMLRVCAHYEEIAVAALTAALAVDGLCLVPSNILAELRKRDDTINQIGPRGEELMERVIANERANAWPIVSAMLAAASTGDPPRQEKP